MILMVPRDAAFYPTLGPQVCDFIEQNMVYGPGDLRGQPVVLDDEWRGLIFRMYEVFPKGHAQAGRRRFKRVGLSLPKGTAKTERAAMIAICELHPDAPVRCTGFTKGGEPIGGPVTDPYIPMIAYSQTQADELAFTALRVILENCGLRDDFDIGLERILRKKGDGKCEALSSNPNARDGARTTFAVLDETHRWILARLLQAHTVVQTNVAKRKGADGYVLEVTTAPEPGAGSVAEATMEYAKAIELGKVLDPRLFYYHRQAGDQHDLTTREGRLAAIAEASGAAKAWRDLDAIEALWNDPGADVAYLERVYCNRLVKGSTQAFDVEHWKTLERKDYHPKPGAVITLGFDGSQFHDGTGIVATEVATGFQWVAGLWECPPDGAQMDPPWKVPNTEVDRVVRKLFDEFTVWRMYADPPFWESWIAMWQGDPKLGEERVVEWWTKVRDRMTKALVNYWTAMKEKAISHDGDPRLIRHLGNARRKDLQQRDEQGRPLWLIQKDRQDSPNKMDLAMCSCLSWQARTDAIASGVLTAPIPQFQIMIFGGARR